MVTYANTCADVLHELSEYPDLIMHTRLDHPGTAHESVMVRVPVGTGGNAGDSGGGNLPRTTSPPAHWLPLAELADVPAAELTEVARAHTRHVVEGRSGPCPLHVKAGLRYHSACVDLLARLALVCGRDARLRDTRAGGRGSRMRVLIREKELRLRIGNRSLIHSVCANQRS